MLKKVIKGLISTTEEELETIKKLESEGKFNEHTSDGGVMEYTPVGEDFEYIPKNNFKNFWLERLIVKPFIRISNRLLQTEVTGRENLKGLKGAIVCCNHVNKLDSCALIKALSYKRAYFVGAEFNNYKGVLGDSMRIGGLLPLSSTFSGMKNFNKTVSELLKNDKLVTFFPERAEWWCYRKPRPMIDGAFKYAVKNNVPVLPVFITFKESKASKQSKTGIPKFIVNILPPIYKEEGKSDFENVQAFNEKTFNAMQDCYKKFYNVK